MIPATIRRIDEAIAASPRTLTPEPGAELLELAVGAVRRAAQARSYAEADDHVLRAIAYLVRRVEMFHASDSPPSPESP